VLCNYKTLHKICKISYNPLAHNLMDVYRLFQNNLHYKKINKNYETLLLLLTKQLGYLRDTGTL